MRFVIVSGVCICLMACQPPQQWHGHPTSARHLPPTTQPPMTIPAESEMTLVETDEVPSAEKTALPSSTQLLSLIVNEAPIQEVLFGIAKESGLNMDIHPGLRGKITLHVVKATLPSVLARMAQQVDMRYQYKHGVWLITPDTPEIRSYRLNYVNINRDTTAFIGAASEISGGIRNLANTSSGNLSVGSSNNSSRTAVTSQSKYHLWETIIQNLQTLLEESDKSLVLQRVAMHPDSQGLALRLTPEYSGAAHEETEQHQVEIKKEAKQAEMPDSLAEREQKRQELTRWLGARLIANPETGIVAIRASHRQHQMVKHYLESVMRVASRQVLIEATIVEVELTHSYQMGIDWSRLSSSANQQGWLMGQSLGSPAASINRETGSIEANNSKNALGENNGTTAFVLSYLNPLSKIGNLSASVTLLEQFGKTRVLSSPKLMVMNNQTAILKVVDNLVYFTIQSQISQSTGTAASNLLSVTTSANTVPVGLVMAVTAQINGQQHINLNVRPTVSKVLRYVQDPNPQLVVGTQRILSSIPEIQVREMESVLRIHSGEVAILGGLMQDDERNYTDQVPGLSSLPGVGSIFRGRNSGSKKTELVVFLRPTVIAQANVAIPPLNQYEDMLPPFSANNALNAQDTLQTEVNRHAD